ncbi:MAG: GNAT family N-acetyltransferase [Nitrososphaerales archaeon]
MIYPKEELGNMWLRPMTESDLPFMLEIRNEVRDLIHDNRVFTLDQCIEWYHSFRPENYVVAISDSDVGIMRVRRDKHHAYAVEIGGDIHKDFRRRGYGVRAYKVLIPFLFNTPQINELFLEVLETNMPAFNLYLKLGFQMHAYDSAMAQRVDRELAGYVMNLTQQRWEKQ